MIYPPVFSALIALRRDRANAALGPDGLGPDHHAQGRRLGNARSARR